MATTSTANKDYKGEVNMFVAVITLRCKRVDLKKSYDVF